MKSPVTKSAAATLKITAALIAVHKFNGPLDRAILSGFDLPGNVGKCKTLTWKINLLDKATILRCMALEPYYLRVTWPSGKVWLVDRRKKTTYHDESCDENSKDDAHRKDGFPLPRE